MKNRTCQIIAGATLALSLLISGCVQMPTEKSGVSDMRPQISFNVQSEGLLGARVNVDGLEVGAVGDYVSGKATLRILPGNHRIQVISADRIVLDEKAYIGDGVTRSFLVQ